MPRGYERVEYYDEREKMREALMGSTPKLGRPRAEFKFSEGPDYLADAKRRLLKYAKEKSEKEKAEEERQALKASMLSTQNLGMNYGNEG
jgi:hypothetical protein